jgi:DNA-nicking Smr family endonuclease
VAKKNLTSEDSHLFRKTIGKVSAIKSDKVLLTKEKKPKPIPRPASPDMEEYLVDTAETDIESVTPEDTLSFLAPGVQKNVLKKLRRGYFGLDAEIDLHGLNSHEAKRQLLKFLHICIEDGCRCVHVVHGKGYRSPDNHPVLKNNLNLWLRQHKEVLAFCSASQKNGGAGAVFVLLHVSEKYRDERDDF